MLALAPPFEAPPQEPPPVRPAPLQNAGCDMCPPRVLPRARWNIAVFAMYCGSTFEEWSTSYRWRCRAPEALRGRSAEGAFWSPPRLEG